MSTYKSNYNIDKKYAECPYNPNHKVPANRMPIHLIKCEKQSDLVLMVCPFNASHRCPKEKYQEHLNECKNRTNVIKAEIVDRLLVPKPTVGSDPLKPYESGAEEVTKEEDGEEYWD